jgi:sulfur-oxidizing protein SoxY
MKRNSDQSGTFSTGRRRALRILGAGGIVAGALSLGAVAPAFAAAGSPQPGEKVSETLQRLFGGRPLQPAGDRIKFEAPTIAENGAVVPVRVESSLPMAPDKYVKRMYIIADKNRRPLNASFGFTPESGSASFGTNIRLGESSDVRVVAEMSDGTLYEAKREVKVTVGGCGG